MRWRDGVGDVKEARRAAGTRLMYKELSAERGTGRGTDSTDFDLLAARTCPTEVGCRRAGWLRAQPLDSATCMRLHIARPTCISSLPLGRSGFCTALAFSVRPFRVRGNSQGKKILFFVYGSTAADQWYNSHYCDNTSIDPKRKLVFGFCY